MAVKEVTKNDVMAARVDYLVAHKRYDVAEERIAGFTWREARDLGLLTERRTAFEEMTRAWWMWNDRLERWLANQSPALTPEQVASLKVEMDREGGE